MPNPANYSLSAKRMQKAKHTAHKKQKRHTRRLPLSLSASEHGKQNSLQFFERAGIHLRARRGELLLRAVPPQHADRTHSGVFRRLYVGVAVADEHRLGGRNAQFAKHLQGEGRIGFDGYARAVFLRRVFPKTSAAACDLLVTTASFSPALFSAKRHSSSPANSLVFSFLQ